MIVVAIIALLAAIAIPNLVHARGTGQANACINNLREIDNATQQWALEKGRKSTQAADPDEVKEYMWSRSIPDCPTGASYNFAATIGTVPSISCPVGNSVEPNHVLP